MSDLDKTAISWGRLRIAQSRKGRRPMSVDTFLRKEKDGSLYKASAPSFLSKEKKLEKRVKRQVKKLERVADNTLGLKSRNLLQRRTLGNELVGKVKNEFDSLGLKLGEAHKDQIPGGLADDSEPKDFPADQIEKGVKVEREHTDDDSLAKQIAMDHLKEFPNYYDALDEMEKKLEAKKKEAGVLQQVGEVLTTPIPGTPKWLLGGEDPALRTTGLRALKPLRPRPTVTRGSVTSINPADYGIKDEELARLQPKVAEVGPMESRLPWYGTVGLGAAGGLAGQHVAPAKYKTLGLLAGTLLGTGVGLEGGLAAGKALDQRAARKKQEAQWAARRANGVFSDTFTGRPPPTPEDIRRNFEWLLESSRRADAQQPKLANSGGTMQRMVGEGASRGPDHYIMEEPELRGRPATSKVKPGDGPTRDEAPEYRHPSLEANNTNRSLDLAAKVATISADENEFPTSEDGPEQDPASSRRVEMFGYQHSSETPVPGYNPDWKKKAHVQRAMRDELQKLCCVKQAAIIAEDVGPAGSYQRALQATERLQELAKKKPTREQLGRGAVAGAIVGTGSTLANKTISGDLIKTYAEAMGKAPKGLRGKLMGVGTGTLNLGRSMAGGAAGSAVFGASLPVVSGEINRRAEMNRLKEYIAGNPSSRLRRAVSEYTGV